MNNREQSQEIVYDLRERGFTWEYIGNELGVSRKTAARIYREYEERVPEVVKEYPEPSNYQERFKPLEFSGDAIISCDWHVPLHSPRMVNSLLETAYNNNIKTLGIIGDFFNMDQFSHYLPHQPEASFNIEREEGTSIIEACLDVFDEIIFSWGNHDFRIVKFLGYKHSYTACMNWVLEDLEDKLDRIRFTDLDYVVYHPGNYDIRLCHPQNFSKVPLTVARGLVPKYGMSVLTAHSHHFAQGAAIDGKNLVFDGGGLFDPRLTEYVQKTNLHHNWVQGFHMWKDGLCYPFSPIYYNL